MLSQHCYHTERRWVLILKKFNYIGNTGRVSAMLVLSRKVGEKILIGENVVVTVVRVSPGVVRIGIEAPDDLAIVRSEIQEVSPDPAAVPHTSR